MEDLRRQLAKKLKDDIGYEVDSWYMSSTLLELIYLAFRRNINVKLKRLTKYQAKALALICLGMEKLDLWEALKKCPLPTGQEQTSAMLGLLTLARTSLRSGNPTPTAETIASDLTNEYIHRKAVCGFSDKHFYKSREWKELRLAILAAGRYCRLCGATPQSGAILHVDHIKPRSLFPHLSLEPTNMQVLCSVCNVAKSNLVNIKF